MRNLENGNMLQRVLERSKLMILLACALTLLAAGCGDSDTDTADATADGTGGAATGGVATGGAATGGAATGGAATGGASTGGAATGGAATGGMATGGMATGGMATGGMATGGMTPMDTNVQVRVVHASAEAPTVDAFLEAAADVTPGTTTAAATLAFGESTPVLDIAIPNGTTALPITLLPSGSTDDSDEIELMLDVSGVVEGGQYTVLVIGNPAATDATGLQFKTIPAAWFDNATDMQAGVIVVHGAGLAPAVDIDIDGDRGNMVDLQDVPFGASSADASSEAVGADPTADIPVDVYVDIATMDPAAAQFVVPNAALEADSDYIVVAVGDPTKLPGDNGDFDLLIIPDPGMDGMTTTVTLGQNPVLIPFHLSPDAPAVDIYADFDGPMGDAPAEIFNQVPYLGAGTIQVPPGTAFDVIIDPDDDGDPSNGLMPFPIAADALTRGNTYWVLAVGEAAPDKAAPDTESAFTLLTVPVQFGPAPVAGETSVRVVHASPDAPTVSVGINDSMAAGASFMPVGPLNGANNELAYGTASTRASIMSNTLDPMNIDLALNTTTSTFTFSDITTPLPAEARVNVFAVGAAAPDNADEDPFGLIIVDVFTEGRAFDGAVIGDLVEPD